MTMTQAETRAHLRKVTPIREGERLYWIHGFNKGRPHICAEVPGMSPEEAMQTAVAQNAELLWDGDYSGPVWSECQRSEVQDVTDTTEPGEAETTHMVFYNGWWHKVAAKPGDAS